MQAECAVTSFQESLQEQVDLLEQIGSCEQDMQRAVMTRDWPKLERTIEHMTGLSDGVYRCEAARTATCSALCRQFGLPETAQFSVLLGHLPAQERREISSLYRRLKIAVYRIQTLTNGIGSYVSSSRQAMEQVMEEVFPAARGRIYSRDGNVRGKQPPAMVVNHSL